MSPAKRVEGVGGAIPEAVVGRKSDLNEQLAYLAKNKTRKHGASIPFDPRIGCVFYFGSCSYYSFYQRLYKKLFRQSQCGMYGRVAAVAFLHSMLRLCKGLSKNKQDCGLQVLLVVPGPAVCRFYVPT